MENSSLTPANNIAKQTPDMVIDSTKFYDAMHAEVGLTPPEHGYPPAEIAAAPILAQPEMTQLESIAQPDNVKENPYFRAPKSVLIEKISKSTLDGDVIDEFMSRRSISLPELTKLAQVVEGTKVSNIVLQKIESEILRLPPQNVLDLLGSGNLDNTSEDIIKTTLELVLFKMQNTNKAKHVPGNPTVNEHTPREALSAEREDVWSVNGVPAEAPKLTKPAAPEIDTPIITAAESATEEPAKLAELPAIHDEDAPDWWDEDETPTQLERPATLEDASDLEEMSPGKNLVSLWDGYKASDRSKEFIAKHKDQLYDQIAIASNEFNAGQVVFEDLDNWEFSKAIELLGDSLHAIYQYSKNEKSARKEKASNDNLIAQITKRWFDAKNPPTDETAGVIADLDDDEDLIGFTPDGATTILPAEAATDGAVDTTEEDDDDDFSDFVADDVDDEPAAPTDASTMLPGIDPGLITEAKPTTEVEKRQRRVGKYLSKIINETGIWNLSRGELSAAYKAGLDGEGNDTIGAIANKAGSALRNGITLAENRRNRSSNKVNSQVSAEANAEPEMTLEKYLASFSAKDRAVLEGLPYQLLLETFERQKASNGVQRPKPNEQPQSEAEQKGLARRALDAAQATRQRNIGR